MARRAVLGALILLLGFLAQPSGLAGESLPGSRDDPLVTKGYLDSYLQSAFGPLRDQITALEGQVQDLEKRTAEMRQKLKTKIWLALGQSKALVGDKEYTLELAPFLLNDRTMLPFRFIGEALGAEVGWEAGSRTVSYRLEGTEVLLTIDSNQASKNGAPVTLDVPPQLVKNRTVVPVRLVSELLGAQVQWDEKNQAVTITR